MDAYADTKPAAAANDAGGGESKKLSLVDNAKMAKKWTEELTQSKKWLADFTEAGFKCEKAYMGPKPNVDAPDRSYAGKVNLFWSNVQVILSAIYGRLPKAEVDRKFGDFTDDVARVAGIIMQRILNGDIEREYDDTSAAMRDAVQDRFIVGLGQVWCRYDVEIGTHDEPLPPDPMTGQPALDPQTGQPATRKVEHIASEEAETDYVYWADFRYSPCRRWRDCRWVARRVYMSKDRLQERFKLNESQLGMVPLQARSMRNVDGDVQDDVLRATPFQQAAVWEIWCKDEFYVCWYVEGCSFVLDYQDDPLQLEDFFPCPQPVVATTLTKAFIARADYAMTQDLYKELDRVNARICKLTDAVRAVGVYDKNAGALRTLLSATDNELIPVDNWSALVEKGGLKGVTDFVPIEAYVNAIIQLNQRKQQLEHDLYNVLGVSDIMRGATVASETATAQTLKAQYGGARLANLQNEVARFVSETMRIRANIVANHFQPETITKRSLIMLTPDAQLAQPAIAMLKDFGTSLYSINVTADSLAAPDWAEEKEARTEFLGAASNYIMAAGPIVQQSPLVGSFLIKLLQWAAAGFKGAKTIEGVLDEAARAMQQQAAAPPPPPPPPNPEDKKNIAQAGKYDAEAERTKKESALIPPMGGPPMGSMPPMGPPGAGGPGGPPGGPGGPPGGMPGGPQPGGPGGPGGPHPLGAAPGSVAPPLPVMPQPVNRMPQ